MNFIDPKTNFAFKRIFGSPESPPILLSFLNALLYEGDPIIQGVEIRPEHSPENNPLQEIPLTVKAQMSEGETCLIEMQVLNLLPSGKRVLYQAAKSYVLQLNKGERNPEIKPLMAVTLTDVSMFGEEANIISRFALKEVENSFDYPYNELGLVFVELPKFQKELSALETITDKWIYFIKNASQLDEIPESLAEVPEIQQAFQLAYETQLTREEFDLLQQQLFWISDQRRSLLSTQNEGLQQGIQQGIQQGMEQGMEQGLQKGKEQGLQEGREKGLQEGIQQGRNQGIEEGRQEGVKAGQFALILRLLTRRFGKLDPKIQKKIKQLSREQLELLAESAWDFITDLELVEWLESNT